MVEEIHEKVRVGRESEGFARRWINKTSKVIRWKIISNFKHNGAYLEC